MSSDRRRVARGSVHACWRWNVPRSWIMGLVAGVLSASLLSGCTTDAIQVSDGTLASDVDYHWLLSTREGERAVFLPTDDKVVLSVRFGLNYRASYEWYKVEWIDPSGRPYKVVSTRTEFGSHRDLKAELAIRGKMAAALPGVWRVRLTHLGRDGEPDRLLISRLFRIEEMTPEMREELAVDAPPVTQTRPLAGTLPGQEMRAADSVTPDSEPPRPEPRPSASSTPAAAGAQAADSAPATTQPRVASTPAAPLATSPSTTPAGAPASPTPLDAGSSGRAPRTQARSRGTARGAAPRWPGCPPMYYAPGPDCVEQAAEE